MSARYFLLFLLTVSATVASAQETPAIGRGIAPEKLYQTGDIDSVDLQSGASP